MALSHDKNVAEVFVIGLFLGIHFVTFLKALRWLLCDDQGWKRRRGVDWIMLVITVVIFGSTIARAVFGVRNTMVAVMEPPDSVAASTHYGPVATPSKFGWVTMADCVAANLPILLSDAVFLYRLWIVYGKYYPVVIFPALLWVGALICTILQVFWQSIKAGEIDSSWRPVNMSIGPGPILTPFWGATMVLNIYATVLMSRRIWLMTKASEGVTATHSLKFLMRVFIESGCIYIIVTTSHFIVWWTPNSYAISLVATMNTPMTGIAFNLITIRTYKNRAQESMEAAHRPHASTLHFKVPTVQIPPSETSSWLDPITLNDNNNITTQHSLAPSPRTDQNV